MANNTEKRITAKMILDSTGYNGKLKGLNAEMRKHQSELKLASEGIKTFGKDTEKLKSVQESLSKQLELHNKKIDMYKKSIEKANTKMQDNIKTRDKIKESLDKANKKYEEAVKVYGKESNEAKKAKEEVDRLSKEHEKASKTVETNAKQVQNYETNLDKAKTQMVKTQGELKKVNSELDKSNNKWLKASEGFKKSSEKLKTVGGKISNAGDSILKITAPLTAGGIASLKFATDFENSIAKVSTIADTTQVPINDLRKGILKLSSDTGIASTDIADDVYNAISAGQKTGDAVNFVRNSTKLAKAGFAESGQALDLLTTILNSYGMEAKEVTTVSDVLINTQNLGKTSVGELSSSMGKVIPTAKSMGINLQQVASGYAIMTAKGIKSAETTTYMNSMFNELGKSGTKASDVVKKVSGKSFQDLIKSGKTVGDVLAMMNDYAKKNNLSLADLFGSAEAGKASLILSANAGKDFNEMLKSMNNTAGATDKAFEKVSNTTGEKFKKSLNKMKNQAIRFGDAIAPLMDKATELIGKLSDKLSGLSDEQLQSIAKWGAMSIATGCFLKITGKTIVGVGNVIGTLSKLTGWLGKTSVATEVVGSTASAATGVASAGLTSLAGIVAPVAIGIAAVGATVYLASKNTQYLGEKCNKSAEDMGTMETAMAGLNGHIIHTNKELEEMNVKHKEWNSKVSKDSQKALDGIANKIANYNMEIKGASKLDKLADKETSTKLNKNLDDICNSAINKIKSRQPEIKKVLEDSFKVDGIDKDEKKILDALNKKSEEEIKIVQNTKKKILDLEKKAAKQQGAEKEKTLQEINVLTQKIGNIEMKNTVKSKEELLAAQADFNARMKNLDMQGVSKIMQEKAKIRNTETKKIKENYDKQIEYLKLNYNNVDGETKKAIDTKIKKLEGAKKKEIGIENAKYKGYLDAAIEKYPQLLNYLDLKNGEMLTKAEQQKQAELVEYASKMNGMLDVTQTGYYKIKDSVTGQMRSCYVEVDNATGKITGAWDLSTGKIYGNPIKAREDIDKDLKNGARFRPITEGWDRNKQAIWKNAAEVQSKKNYNLFDWVRDAHGNAQSWLSKHPFISSVVQQVLHPNQPVTIPQNWTGNKFYEGGFTTLHERGYELYDLPRSTRIYNHEASEELVMQTAENVATKVANSVLRGNNGNNGINVTQYINTPNPMPSEIARKTKNNLRELALNY